MPDDIVTRLREALGECPTPLRAYFARAVVLQAADEIERLRNELTERIHMCDMRSEKILVLTAQRDEARRELCWFRSLSIECTPKKLAEHRCWDCFKEDGK